MVLTKRWLLGHKAGFRYTLINPPASSRPGLTIQKMITNFRATFCSYVLFSKASIKYNLQYKYTFSLDWPFI